MPEKFVFEVPPAGIEGCYGVVPETGISRYQCNHREFAGMHQNRLVTHAHSGQYDQVRASGEEELRLLGGVGMRRGETLRLGKEGLETKSIEGVRDQTGLFRHVRAMSQPDSRVPHAAGEFGHFPEAGPPAISGALQPGCLDQEIPHFALGIQLLEGREFAPHRTIVRGSVLVSAPANEPLAYSALNGHSLKYNGNGAFAVKARHGFRSGR